MYADVCRRGSPSTSSLNFFYTHTKPRHGLVPKLRVWEERVFVYYEEIK